MCSATCAAGGFARSAARICAACLAGRWPKYRLAFQLGATTAAVSAAAGAPSDPPALAAGLARTRSGDLDPLASTTAGCLSACRHAGQWRLPLSPARRRAAPIRRLLHPPTAPSSPPPFVSASRPWGGTFPVLCGGDAAAPIITSAHVNVSTGPSDGGCSTVLSVCGTIQHDE